MGVRLSSLLGLRFDFHPLGESIERMVAVIAKGLGREVGPALQAAQSQAKQNVSDALARADSALAANHQAVAAAVERAIDAEIVNLLGPLGGVVFNPVVNDALDQLANTAAAAAHNAILDVKARIAAPIPAPANPPPPGA